MYVLRIPHEIHLFPVEPIEGRSPRELFSPRADGKRCPARTRRPFLVCALRGKCIYLWADAIEKISVPKMRIARRAAAGGRGRDARKTLRAFERDEPADRRGRFISACSAMHVRPSPSLHSRTLSVPFRAKLWRPQEHSGMRQSSAMTPNGAAACDISQRYRRIRHPPLRMRFGSDSQPIQA